MTDRARRLPIWQAAGAAFLAMVIQDLLATIMVISEAHFDAPAAASMDVLGYLAGLACSALALDSILKDGWRTRRSLTIIAAVSLANGAGTWLGVFVGRILT